MTVSKRQRRLFIAVAVLIVAALGAYVIGQLVKGRTYAAEAGRIAGQLEAAGYNLNQAIAAVEAAGGNADETHWIWLANTATAAPPTPVVWSRDAVFGRHWVILKNGQVEKMSPAELSRRRAGDR